MSYFNYNNQMQAVNPGEGREYTIQDDKGPKDILLRCKKGVFLTPAYVQELQQGLPIFGQASSLLQTKDGSIVIVASEKKFMVYDLLKRTPLLEQDCGYIYSMTLSPGQRFLQILQKVDSNEGKTFIINLQTLKTVAIFKENAYTNYYNKSSYPLVKISSDDNLFFRYSNKTVEVYDSSSTLQRVIKTGVLDFFELSLISTEKNYRIAAVYLDKKTNKGCLQLFSHDKEEPLYEKTINKAEQIIIKFSPTQNTFLIELQTYHDPTGKSYYGEFGLYIYSEEKGKIFKIKTASGPVHDFLWDKKGEHFLVISGFMPAEPVLFSKNNEVVFQFGKQHSNTIIWGNLGRLVCFGGFGNLSGEMQIWDMVEKKKIGACKSSSSSFCSWSTDDRKLITAILTPRLRVDNCYKIFSYTGVLLHKSNYDHTELYEAVWLNNSKFTDKDARGLSPNRKNGGEAKSEVKFQSFAASLNFEAMETHYQSPIKTKKPSPHSVPSHHHPPEKNDKTKKTNKKRVYREKVTEQN